jgi:hypothetical protein
MQILKTGRGITRQMGENANVYGVDLYIAARQIVTVVNHNGIIWTKTRLYSTK